MTQQDKKFRYFATDELLCTSNEAGRIGRGTFGEVILAFHDVHNAVALKCMSSFGGGARKVKNLEKKIKNELENLYNANHENVVRVLGWTQWSNTVAIVMEYLPGGNLMELIDDDDVELKPFLQLRICAEVANGLSFIHNFSQQKRLIHGDIKAENVLLTHDLHCKISDFGSAKVSTYTGAVTLTESQVQNIQFIDVDSPTPTPPEAQQKSQFTEVYAAPEFIKCPTMDQKPSYDTYSYSILVYVVLCRQLPVKSNAHLKLYKEAIIRGQRADLINLYDCESEIEKKCQDTLKTVMKDCWHQEPLDRPTMVVVKEKLCGVLNEIPSADVLQSAVSAVEKVQPRVPMKQQYNCFPLSRLHPYRPTDQQTGEHSLLPGATSMSSPVGSSVSPLVYQQSSSDEHTTVDKEMLQTLHSIKFSLEKKEVERAVSETRRLVSMTTITQHADVIIDYVSDISKTFDSVAKHSASFEIIEWGSGVCKNIKDAEKRFQKLSDLCEAAWSSLHKSPANAEVDIQGSCLPLFCKLKEQMKATHISDNHFKTECSTKCSLYIGRCHYYIGNGKESLQIAKSCLSTVKSLYGDNVKKRQILASCYYLLACANLAMSNYSAAIDFCQCNIETIKSAEDIQENEKAEWLRKAKEQLRLAQSLVPSQNTERGNSLFHPN